MKIRKFLSLILIAATVVMSFSAGEKTVAADQNGSVSMYRMYNPNSGEHFYTSNGVEKDMLVKAGWWCEGTGWVGPNVSDTPVYRMYNSNAGDHHYTTSAGERDYLVRVGWNYEGIGWYSSDENTLPVYREYNPNAVTGAHNYTTNAGEDSMLASVGWKQEGIGWYALEAGSAYERPEGRAYVEPMDFFKRFDLQSYNDLVQDRGLPDYRSDVIKVDAGGGNMRRYYNLDYYNVYIGDFKGRLRLHMSVGDDSSIITALWYLDDPTQYNEAFNAIGNSFRNVASRVSSSKTENDTYIYKFADCKMKLHT